ncbi:odorant receptor 13a-like [Hylaeus anthracinus]|uniref:odorant receptor 13a-like n=1 Tax=Hylaeus anthracinus TaxID=313031 RepID=UPI0023B9E031|nr:odorant receptor 13a-like [Hylaeus anthracinus]
MEAETFSDISIKISTFYLKFATLWAVTLNASLLLILIKVYVMTVNKVKLNELIQFMKDHFWKHNYNYREKEILADSSMVCSVIAIAITIGGHAVVTMQCFAPIIANMGKNETDRILPFNMLCDFILISPYYEIFYFVQQCIITPSCVFFCFDEIICLMSLHVSAQFRILQYRLVNLYDTIEKMQDDNANVNVTMYSCKCYEKLKNCIRQHQDLINFSAKIEEVFTLIIFAETTMVSGLICLLGYQMLSGTVELLSRLSCGAGAFGSSVLLLMVMYSCNDLIVQSDNVSLSAYSAPWTLMPMDKFGRSLRNDLMMVSVRSRRVCCLTANGFFPISLETYSKIMSTAVSYFTLLTSRTESMIED